jgi:hypothetical protein
MPIVYGGSHHSTAAVEYGHVDIERVPIEKGAKIDQIDAVARHAREVPTVGRISDDDDDEEY